MFAKLLTSKAILGKRPLEVQVQNIHKSFCILTVFMVTFMGLIGANFICCSHQLPHTVFITVECTDQKASFGVDHKFYHTSCEETTLLFL